MTNKLVTKEDTSVEAFISQAIKSNVPVETLERLLAMRKEVMAEQAKVAFIESLTDFQSKVPVIRKLKKVLNKDKSLRYLYAPLDSVVEQIKKPLAEDKLSYSWETENEEGYITAIAKLTHILGHSETSKFKVPIDKNEYMTSPQRYASALTYAKRHALCNVLGIATAEEDTDATDVKKPKDAKSPKARIVFLLRVLGYATKTPEQCQTATKDETGLELKEENYEEIITRLEVKVEEKQEHDKSTDK